ncbi:uncharacterized protein SAPINGB_P006014 [Magnusiomyces paraingens]|uniref:threonine--tRNA ligase n=1 Tax=Magnusiomyces paraingens TaxID=2606893 RepID=A0A5E8C2S8_9ASCO|nr:uncharacterized protein SAPINGB_P006014 [Saprochaete ingens]VVT58054.1 unnamed protein product [Saprochaete ingens]
MSLIKSAFWRPAVFSTTKPAAWLYARLMSTASKKNATSIANEGKTIANKQQLYVIDHLSPGSIFFLPHGARIFNRLVEFMRAQQRCYGFEEVVTPLIYKDDLWKTSGHWKHYKDDMFQVSAQHHKDTTAQTTSEGETPETTTPSEPHTHTGPISDEDALQIYGLKPMNCPGHCVMYSKHPHSFRDLPIRYSDFSPLHRNESSGALSGLTRVRKFHQDDGHIFCLPSQIQAEIEGCLKMIQASYSVFKLNEFRFVLSTRPESYAGSLEVWDKAEENLKQALNNSGREWELNPGDGAFYGPKIDILVKDNNGKEHQTATIQLDFQLPQNFHLKYVTGSSTTDSATGAITPVEETPVLIHRAIFGSLERFMAILIDHFNGHWPFWLNPRQAVIIPIASRHHEYASAIFSQLSGKYNFKYTYPSVSTSGSTDAIVLPELLHSRYFNVDLFDADETVGARTRRAISEGYSYIIVVGDKEMEDRKLSIRTRESRNTQYLDIDQTISMFSQLEDAYQ